MIRFDQLLIRLALFVFLIIPFLLREINSELEPYPAVLLPAGTGKISVTAKEVSFSQRQIFAVFPDGNEQLLNPAEFFPPIPEQYWTEIARNRFGLGPERSRSISLGIWTLTVRQQREADTSERRETVEWLQGRLQNLGISDAIAIRVRRMRITYNVEKRLESKREVVEEFDVNFNQ